MNIVFLNNMDKDSISKRKIERTLKKHESTIQDFKEREPFLLEQEVAIVGSRINNNIIIEKIVPLVV